MSVAWIQSRATWPGRARIPARPRGGVAGSGGGRRHRRGRDRPRAREGAEAGPGPAPLLLPRRCTCPRPRAASLARLVARRTAARRLDRGRALAARARVGRRAPAHERARLRLPARLVARRPPARLRVLSRRCGRAARARARERAQPRRCWRTARSTSSRAGRRTAAGLAFVSTAHEGALPRVLLDAPGGQAGEPKRLTEERDSGLPRYYYSRLDQYLSPARRTKSKQAYTTRSLRSK